jgi:uncharacterized protein YgiM (DUF1202 family)
VNENSPQQSNANYRGCGWALLIFIVLIALIDLTVGDPPQHDPSLPPARGAALDFSLNQRVYVVARRLNLRAQPSTSGQKLGALSQGDSFRVLDRTGEWLQLSHGGEKPWVSAIYVSSTRPESSAESRGGASERQTFFGGGRRATPARRSYAVKQCKKGKPCGRSCIARDRVCRK